MVYSSFRSFGLHFYWLEYHGNHQVNYSELETWQHGYNKVLQGKKWSEEDKGSKQTCSNLSGCQNEDGGWSYLSKLMWSQAEVGAGQANSLDVPLPSNVVQLLLEDPGALSYHTSCTHQITFDGYRSEKLPITISQSPSWCKVAYFVWPTVQNPNRYSLYYYQF